MKQELIDKYICGETICVLDAMGMIDSNRSGTLFIVNHEDALVGAVTDGDIRRWILKAGDLKEPVRTIMNCNPKYLFEGQEDKADNLIKSNFIRVIPVVDSFMRVVSIINYEDTSIVAKGDLPNSLSGIPVVIMAGGKGTRLYPYTKILPKPLIPIGETPIVERIIKKFTDYGVDQFYMTVNYKKGMIKTYFGDLNPDYKIEYVEEDIPLGTAGSIKLINKVFNRPVFVANCDTMIMAEYNTLYKHHLESGNDITVVSALKNITLPYGVIHSGRDGKINHIEEKPRLSYFINTGMYIINPSVIRFIPEREEYHMTDLVEDVIQNGGSVGTFPIGEDSFLDMGELSELKRMEEKLDNTVL